MPAAGTADYTSAVVLGIATAAIHDYAGGLLSGARDGRLLAELTRTTSEARNSDGNEFELPPMAMGDTINTVLWIDSLGTEWPLELIPEAMEPIFYSATQTGQPTAYAFRDGTIRVFPKPDSSGSLKMRYARRHGALTTLAADYNTVTSVASASSTDTNITVGAIPSTVVAGAWVDVIGKYAPYRTKMHGLRVVSAGGGVVRVSTPLAAFTAANTAGDFIAIYGKTPVLQIPLEMREPFTRHVSSRILAELGDLQLADGYDKMAIVGGMRAQNMFSPRAKTDRAKLKSPHSLARSSSVRRRS